MAYMQLNLKFYKKEIHMINMWISQEIALTMKGLCLQLVKDE